MCIFTNNTPSVIYLSAAAIGIIITEEPDNYDYSNYNPYYITAENPATVIVRIARITTIIHFCFLQKELFISIRSRYFRRNRYHLL